MNPNNALRGKGDFTKIAETMRKAQELQLEFNVLFTGIKRLFNSQNESGAGTSLTIPDTFLQVTVTR